MTIRSTVALAVALLLLLPATSSRASTPTSSATGAAQLVDDEPEGEEGSEGGGGLVTGLTTVGMGCLFGVLPTTLMVLPCAGCGALCACPLGIVSGGLGGLLGAGFESGFDGERLIWPAVVGLAVGGGVGILATGAGLLTSLITTGAASLVVPRDPTLALASGAAVRMIIAGVTGGVMLLGAIGAGVGAGIAYSMSGGGGDEADELDEDESAGSEYQAPGPAAPAPYGEAPPIVPAPAQPAPDDQQPEGLFY